MSVARSAYRQLLRVGKAVSTKYVDPNDLCFALFGVLVSRHDFINAGYGSTFPAILRTCFLRPSVAGDPHDTISARTSAAFDALRRLNELKASNAAFGIRELRRVIADAADQKSGAGAADTSEGAPPSPSPLSSSSVSAGSSPSSSAPPAATQLGAVTRGTTVATTHTLDEEGVHLIRGSVLIERSSRRRIQNFTRHCVVCEPISMTFPPYRFCIPPEPSYLLAVRSEFALYALTDVLLALSATSTCNAHRQAYIAHQQARLLAQLQEPPAPRVPGGDGGAADPEAAGPAAGGSTAHAHGEAADSTAGIGTFAALEARRFPTTRAELTELVCRIPTRTVIQTDVLEVEVTTEYLCSNPTAADQAAIQRKEGAFASTTPLKRGPAGEATADGGSEAGDDSKAHLFLYYVTLRNRGPMRNPKRWHAQVLSHHLVVVDVAQAQVLEMGRPGVVGNFPLLQPGAAHCFESGTTLAGPEGILRGSIQVNLFNQAGEVVMLDAAIAPTRLTVEVTSAVPLSSLSNYKGELVQRSSDASSPGSDAPAAAAAARAGTDATPDEKARPKDDDK